MSVSDSLNTVSIKRRMISRLLSATAMSAALVVSLNNPAQAAEAWSDFTDVSGTISIDTSVANRTLINQQTDRYIGNSPNLDIGADQRVVIGQNTADSLFVGRAVKSGSDPTRILGVLQTKMKDSAGNFTSETGGKVMILDRNGVIFGVDSRVDASGIVVSTGDITDADLQDDNGIYNFENFGDGEIELGGRITVADAGLAAFVSPVISNSGVINAKMGRVAMASGEKVTLDLHGDQLIEIAVDDKVANALIENSGRIVAEGGEIIIQAQAAKAIVDSVINMGGVVNASSATVKGGKIILGGGAKGTVNVTGNLKADGATDGGSIEISGQKLNVAGNILNENGSVDINSSRGTELFGRIEADSLNVQGRTIKQDASAIIRASVLTGMSDTYARFWGVRNEIAELGDFATGTFGTAVGAFRLRNTSRLNVTGTVSTQGGNIGITNKDRMDVKGSGSLVSNGGNIVLRAIDNSFMYVDGAVDAGAGDIRLEAGSTLNFRNGSITGDEVDLMAKTVNQNANNTITANILTGNLTKAASLLGANNDINTLGAFTTGTSSFDVGGFLLNNNGRLNIDGDVTTQGGDVTITNAGRMDVTGAGSVLSNGGDINLNASNNSFMYVDGTVDADGGDINLKAGSTLAFRNGSITGDNVDLVAKTVNQNTNNTMTANSLTGNLSKAASLLGANNTIGTLGNFTTGTQAFNAGGFILNNNGSLNIAGAVSSDGGDINILNAGGNMTLNGSGSVVSNDGDITLETANRLERLILDGTVDAGAGNVDLVSEAYMSLRNGSVSGNTVSIDAITIMQNAGHTLKANLLTGTADSQALFNGTGNMISNLGDFTTGEFAYSQGEFLLNNNGRLNIIGTVNSTDGGDVTITNAGRMDVTGAGSVLSNGGNINLNASNNSFMYVDGTVDAGGGDVNLKAGSTLVFRNGSITGDTVDLVAKTVNQNANNTITANILTGNLTKAASLLGTNNTIGTLGNFTTGTQAFNAGGFTLNNNGHLNIAGAVSSDGGDINIFNAGGNVTLNGSGSVVSNDGDITLETANRLERLIFDGTVDAGAGNVDLISEAYMSLRNGSVSGNTVSIDAITIMQNAGHTLKANLLTGTADSQALFNGTGNMISNLGDFTTGEFAYSQGAFTLYNNGELNIVGTVNSTDGGDVTITNAGNLNLKSTGSILSNDGNVSLATVNRLERLMLDGTIDAGAGNVDLTAEAWMGLRNGSVSGNTVTFDTITVSQNAGHTLKSNLLTGTADSQALFNGTGNMISNLGDFTTGEFAYSQGEFLLNNNGRLNIIGTVNSTDGGDVTITNAGRMDVTGAGSVLSNGGDINLNASSNSFMYVDGTVDAGGGDVNLEAGSTLVFRNGSISGDTVDLVAKTVNQNTNNTITANILTGNLTKAASLQGANNNINSIGDFTTGTQAFNTGGFTLNNMSPLDVFGALSTDGGDVNIVNRGTLTVASSGAIETNGGNVDLDVTNLGPLTIAGLIDAASGDVDMNSRTLIGLTGDIFADELNMVSGAILQGLGSTMDVNVLKGSVSTQALLLGLGNTVSELSDFETGTARFANGGFFLYNNGRLNITGNVSTDGGNVTILNAGRMDVKSAGSVLSNGGNINLNASNNSFMYVDGTVDADDGDVNLNAGSTLVFRNGSITGDTVDLVAKTASQNANNTITANTLTGNLKKAASLMGANNNINTIGSFTTGTQAFNAGGFALNNTVALDINGPLSTDGGNVFITNAGDVNVVGGISTNGGDVDLNAATFNVNLLNGSNVKTNNGAFNVEANVFDLDAGALLELGAGSSFIDALTAYLGSDISTTGSITGSATQTFVENDTAEIQDGVDVSADGGVVNVAAGDYAENITIGKTVSVYGDALGGTNLVGSAAGAGFTLTGGDVLIENFTISNFETGLYASGLNNGNIVLNNNLFADNEIGAVLKSGNLNLIDGGPNSFVGGVTGLQFAAIDPALLTLEGNTFGTTSFEGQSGNYIELLNNSFTLAGVPQILDATDVSFDGFVPSSKPNLFLTVDEFNAIEDKIFHLTDLSDRGLVFFGIAPLIDQEDLLQFLNLTNLQVGNLNITLRGLPNLPNFGGGAGTSLVSQLNSIAPAAGNGTTPEELDAIETAAGGTSASCWGDAMSAAGSGQTVSLSYSSSMEDNLNSEISCGGI